MQGVFLDSAILSLPSDKLSLLVSALDTWDWYESTQPTQTHERIKTAQIILTCKVQLTAEVLQAAVHCRCICVVGTGVDHIDLAAAQQQGITVCHVKGYSTDAVAQLTIGFLISLFHHLGDYHDLVRQGAWAKASSFCLSSYPTRELAGKTLGIVGYGAIGQKVAHLAQQFGMHVKIAARVGSQATGARVPLAQLLSQVEVLSLHCPLTVETRYLIGATEFAQMKEGAILLNVARAGLVDEQALAHALRSKHLAGAAVDVLSVEPPLPTHCLLDPSIPNLIVTPHIGWATQEAQQRLVQALVENIQAFIAGKPKNVVV